PSSRIATVTILLGVPLITTRTGIAPPIAASAGIFTLICHNPIYPGISPENCTSPRLLLPPLLPITTHIEGWLFWQVLASDVDTATVCANGDNGAGVPSGTDGLTCPCPVPYRVINVPLGAGFDALFNVLSWLYAAAAP